MHLAYRASYNKGVKIKHGNAHQCYFCSTFYIRKERYDSRIKNCSTRPRIIYDFNLQNLVSFEDTLKYKGDIRLAAYADFETIAPTDYYLDPENRQMFAVSYAIIFVFHPDLKLQRVIIERIFGRSFGDLTSINYLTTEQQLFLNRKTLLQLKDAPIEASRRKNKIAISTMFNIELKFAADLLLK